MERAANRELVEVKEKTRWAGRKCYSGKPKVIQLLNWLTYLSQDLEDCSLLVFPGCSLL